MSLESDLTITPERYWGGASDADAAADSPIEERNGAGWRSAGKDAPEKPSALAGYVGLFTGCGALVALMLFLPLPARFGEMDGVTPAEAVMDSFYVVGIISFFVAAFVFVGLRDLKGEEGKGWRVLLGLKHRDGELNGHSRAAADHAADKQVRCIVLFAKAPRVSLGGL